MEGSQRCNFFNLKFELDNKFLANTKYLTKSYIFLDKEIASKSNIGFNNFLNLKNDIAFIEESQNLLDLLWTSLKWSAMPHTLVGQTICNNTTPWANYSPPKNCRPPRHEFLGNLSESKCFFKGFPRKHIPWKKTILANL